MLLRDRVYIPSIEQLRYDDPQEARTLCDSTFFYFLNLPENDREWLSNRATEAEKVEMNSRVLSGGPFDGPFIKVWGRELAKRRCVWSWHEANIESMALWHIYGREGVAIQTTPALIVKSFEASSVLHALIAPVIYTDGRNTAEEEHHPLRPYLLKQRCYKHEAEVRVIFPRDPELPGAGVLLTVDSSKLIQHIRISPNIPLSEAVEVRKTIIQAWRDRRDVYEHDGDPFVNLSLTKIAGVSGLDLLDIDQSKATGSATFGPKDLPHVMIGDLAAEEADLRSLPS